MYVLMGHHFCDFRGSCKSVGMLINLWASLGSTRRLTEICRGGVGATVSNESPRGGQQEGQRTDKKYRTPDDPKGSAYIRVFKKTSS